VASGLPPSHSAGGPPREDHESALPQAVAVAVLAALVISLATGSKVGTFVLSSGFILAALCVLEWLRWRIDGHWQDATLQPLVRRAVFLRLAASLALAASGFAITAKLALALVSAVLFGFVFWSRRVVARRLRKRGVKPQAAIARRSPRWRLRQLRTEDGYTHLVVSVPRNMGDALFRAGNAMTGWRTLPRYSGAIAGLGLVVCAIAFGQEVLSGPGSGSGTSRLIHRRNVHQRAQPRQVEPDGGNPTIVQPAPRQPAWNGVCPHEVKPSLTGSWQGAAEALQALYERESPLGPAEEGCLEQLDVHSTPGDEFLTADGLDPVTRKQLSFAIDSERFGIALFREPAAALVERTIAQLGAVGGVGRFPDYSVRAGDFYLVRTREGIFVFIRENESAEYIELPPTVARAWLAMMKSRDAWLWPRSPHRGHHRELLYVIWSDDTPEQPEGAIHFEPGDDEAFCNGTAYPAVPVRELGLAELQALAKVA
jgi:hypothetical protein